MKWLSLTLLLLPLGCAVGEAYPGPVSPAEPPAAERPAERPAVPTAEAERLASEVVERAVAAYATAEVAEALELSLQVLREYPGSAAEEAALWLAARSAFGLSRYAEAREFAERYGARQPAGSAEAERARALAELAADALARPAAGPIVGALLPRSGPDVLVQYGDWVLEGIELAIREAERRQGRAIRLVVADDGGGARTAQAVAELEAQGVLAIIGPLLQEQLRQAAGARLSDHLMMVSPTVPETPGHLTNVYSVSSGDTHGARELAWYAVQSGLHDAAVLHSRGTEQQRRAQAFASEFRARGGQVRAVVAYESGTTTFATHMEEIRRSIPSGAGGGAGRSAARSFVLFISAPDRDVPQIAPQVSFYGLDAAGVQVLGDEAWSSSTVRRVVPNRELEGVVASSPHPPGRGEALADPDFVNLFENTYRRSLTNQLPALGYDAARVVVEALPNRLMTPVAAATSFQLLTAIDGATGRLSVRDGILVRTPHLVVIRNGQLKPAPEPWRRVGEPDS